MAPNKMSSHDEILQKKIDLISDHKNSNFLIDILEFNQSDDISTVVESCKALEEIFSHFLSQTNFLELEKTKKSEEDLSKKDQFSSWLKEQFNTTCDTLKDHLYHEDSQVQKAAVDALVGILQAAEQSPKPIIAKLSQTLVLPMLDESHDRRPLVELLPGDLQPPVATAGLTQVKKKVKAMDTAPSNIFLFNYWRLIKQFSKSELGNKSANLITSAVCEFLKNKMPTSLYREILTSISSVMEKMSNPIRLADFLTSSFNLGGAISLMSLHGLFILIYKYNLDYPDFYKKLYSMFEPQVFGAKYKARFFHLADMFLTSSHIPAYVAAAFAKRLARMSLHAPVTGTMVAVPLIFNLLSRHPACQVLVHRAGNTDTMDEDPFIADEPDMAKCRAMDSSLWELQALEHHYSPSLAPTVRQKRIAETDLADLLEKTTGNIIASEVKKKRKGEVPVTFIKPSGLSLPKGFVF